MPGLAAAKPGPGFSTHPAGVSVVYLEPGRGLGPLNGFVPARPSSRSVPDGDIGEGHAARARLQSAAAGLVADGPVIAIGSHSEYTFGVVLVPVNPGDEAKARYVSRGFQMDVPLEGRLLTLARKVSTARFANAMKLMDKLFDGVESKAVRLEEAQRRRP